MEMESVDILTCLSLEAMVNSSSSYDPDLNCRGASLK